MNTIVLQTDYTKDKTSSYLASMETLIEDLNKKDNQRIVVEGQFYSEKSRRLILSYLKDSSRRLLYDYKTELVFYTSENFYTLEQLKANHNFKTFCVPDFNEVDNFEFYLLLSDMRDVYHFYDIPHDNPHHRVGVRNHALLTQDYVLNSFTNSKLMSLYDKFLLLDAAYLHDIGKPLTKTFLDKKGNLKEIAHYYNHASIGAVISFVIPSPDNILDYKDIEAFHRYKWERAWLINHHMDFYNYPKDWTDSQRLIRFKEKHKGNDALVNLLWKLHEADKNCESFIGD